MSANPWGQTESMPTASFNDIVREEGVNKDSKFAEDLHQKLNSLSVDGDVELARQLHEQLNGSEDTTNDALLAAMIQHEMDSEEIAEEKHRNGNCKVSVSSYSPAYKEYHSSPSREFSEDDEQKFFEAPISEPDKSRTKHDKAANSVRNQNRISDKFHPEFKTGDFNGISVPHKVYNELQVEAHKSKFNGIRVKDRRDISTHEKVLDKKTRVVILKMVNSGVIAQVNGIVSSGKESVIIHCQGGRLPGKDPTPVPEECVLKVHKTSLNEFSRRRDYIDKRSQSSLINMGSTKKLIEVWALKEVLNLNRLRRAGVMCPEVVAHRKQILLLSFIGSKGVPALTLKEAVFSRDQLKSAYEQLLAGMKTVFTKCKLVHADLSAYNLLWFNGALYFIDLSQAVLTDHPSALTYLYRDCVCMHGYFEARGLKGILDPRKMFAEVTGLDDLPLSDETAFVTEIEHIQRQEVVNFKHGKESSDYAFESCFNESRHLHEVTSSEEDEEEEEEGDEGEREEQGE